MKMFKQFFKDMPSECLCFGIVGFIALAGLVCSVVFNVDVLVAPVAIANVAVWVFIVVIAAVNYRRSKRIERERIEHAYNALAYYRAECRAGL